MQKNDSFNPKKSIKSGFFWIGSTSIIAQICDAISLIILMIFLTKEEMGVGTLLCSFFVFIEAFNAFGVGTALVQDQQLTTNETHTLFTFSSIFGVFSYALLCLFAFPFAYYYDNNDFVLLFIITAMKFPIVCIANIPLQLINKKLEFKKIAIIQSIATLGSAVSKIALAALGMGAWSLIISNNIYGLLILLSACFASKYKPVLRFKYNELNRFLKYGIKQTFSNAVEQFNKSLHYLFIGKYFGTETLGAYRIAYELAITPAMALLNVVNRSSFPILSKLSKQKDELKKIWLWNTQNISLVVLIPLSFIYFCAKDIFEIINNPTWENTLIFINFILIIALFRTLAQTLPELYRACGKPQFALVIASTETILLLIAFFSSLALTKQPILQHLLIAWIFTYIPIFIIHYNLINKFFSLSIQETLKIFITPTILFIFLTIPALFIQHYRELLPFTKWMHISLQTISALTMIFLFSKLILKIPLKTLIKPK